MNSLLRFTIYAVSIFIFSSCREEKVQLIETGKEHQPLPNFTLIQPDSTLFHSTDFIPNKKLVLFYYSPTCQYCRTQMRETVNNIGKLKNQQFCVIIEGDYSSMKGFSSYFELQNYQNIIIGIDTANIIRNSFRIEGVPFTAVYGEGKLLSNAYLGRISGKGLLNILRK